MKNKEKTGRMCKFNTIITYKSFKRGVFKKNKEKNICSINKRKCKLSDICKQKDNKGKLLFERKQS